MDLGTIINKKSIEKTKRKRMLFNISISIKNYFNLKNNIINLKNNTNYLIYLTIKKCLVNLLLASL